MEITVVDSDLTRLEELEKVVSFSQRKQLEAYNALAEIHSQGLYKARGYNTFEQYTKTEWDIAKSRAYQILAFVDLINRLGQNISVDGLNERNCRPLLGLTEDEAIAVIEDARDNAPGDDPDKIASKDIASSISKLKVDVDKPKQNPNPSPKEESTPVESMSEDDRKLYAKRAMDGLIKFRKNAAIIGIVGPELDKMFNLLEDRLEAI
jgi:hypothetical protein